MSYFDVIIINWGVVYNIARSILPSQVGNYLLGNLPYYGPFYNPRALFRQVTPAQYLKLVIKPHWLRDILYQKQSGQLLAHTHFTTFVNPVNPHSYYMWHYPWKARRLNIDLLVEFRQQFGYIGETNRRHLHRLEKYSQYQADWYRALAPRYAHPSYDYKEWYRDLVPRRIDPSYDYKKHFWNDDDIYRNHQCRFTTRSTPNGVWTFAIIKPENIEVKMPGGYIINYYKDTDHPLRVSIMATYHKY